jgi:hypothetical protein
VDTEVDTCEADHESRCHACGRPQPAAAGGEPGGCQPEQQGGADDVPTGKGVGRDHGETAAGRMVGPYGRSRLRHHVLGRQLDSREGQDDDERHEPCKPAPISSCGTQHHEGGNRELNGAEETDQRQGPVEAGRRHPLDQPQQVPVGSAERSLQHPDCDPRVEAKQNGGKAKRSPHRPVSTSSALRRRLLHAGPPETVADDGASRQVMTAGDPYLPQNLVDVIVVSTVNDVLRVGSLDREGGRTIRSPRRPIGCREILVRRGATAGHPPDLVQPAVGGPVDEVLGVGTGAVVGGGVADCRRGPRERREVPADHRSDARLV